MKKVALVLAVAFFATGLFGADGSAIYKKCIACHGAKAEKSYLNKVPALSSVDAKERLESLKGYKAGTLNKFGMGGIMKAQTAALSEDDLKAVNDHISTLK